VFGADSAKCFWSGYVFMCFVGGMEMVVCREGQVGAGEEESAKASRFLSST
jgi:hypothetical protein